VLLFIHKLTNLNISVHTDIKLTNINMSTIIPNKSANKDCKQKITNQKIMNALKQLQICKSNEYV